MSLFTFVPNLISWLALVFYCLEKTVVQHVITFNLFPGAMFLFQHHFVKGVTYIFFSKPARGFIPEHIEMLTSELKLLTLIGMSYESKKNIFL